MPTLSSLPPECLRIIICQLAHQHDTVSLARLLRVNRYICNATLPILYQNPFDLIAPVSFCSNLPPWYVTSVTTLARTLLLSMPDYHQREFSQRLRVAFLTDPNLITTSRNQDGDRLPKKPPEKPPIFPYYSYITVISLKRSFGLPGSIFRNAFFSSKPALADYLNTAPVHPDVALWGTENNLPAKVTFRAIQRDLTWALCVNAECIRSLVIPLSDIDLYRSLVRRFQVLSDVTFLQEGQYMDTWMMSQDEENTFRLQQPRRTEMLEKMILFVQEHQQKHGATLRTARCSGPYKDDIILEEFKQRLSLLLRPLNDPRILDDGNWDQFLAKFQETNLSFVREVSPHWDCYDKKTMMERLIEKGPFLHRCRALDSVNMYSPGDDIFQWAVDERMSHDADIAAGRIPQTPLVPLRVFKVSCDHKTLGRQLNDVVFAFDKTLEIISASCCWKSKNGNNNIDSNNHQGEQSAFVVGGDDSNSFSRWDLPRLKSLRLSINNPPTFLRIAPDLLTPLLQLTHLTLIDKRHEYKPSEIVSWNSASLPNLVELTLIGTPALSFNPETLRSAHNLVRVDIRMYNFDRPGGSPFIPPTEELMDSFVQPSRETISAPLFRRPMWTWDWVLSKLTCLRLTAEFGYRFEFRMLASTPNLDFLSVESKSLSRTHKRALSLSDLLVPGFDHPSLASIMDEDRQFQELYASDLSNYTPAGSSFRERYTDQDKDAKEGQEGTVTEAKSGIWDEFEYLSLPYLKSFKLSGIWTLNRRTLALLFERVIPNVEYVYMEGTRGYIWNDWEELSWEHLSRLKEAHSSLTIDSERMRNAVNLCLYTQQDGVFLRYRPNGEKVAYHFCR